MLCPQTCCDSQQCYPSCRLRPAQRRAAAHAEENARRCTVKKGQPDLEGSLLLSQHRCASPTQRICFALHVQQCHADDTQKISATNSICHRLMRLMPSLRVLNASMLSATCTIPVASHCCSAMQETILLSADSVEEESGAALPVEYLNTLLPSGLPPHRLTMKVRCPDHHDAAEKH